MKKLISLVVVLVMLTGMLPAMGVSAAAPVADENIALGKPVYASHDRGEGYMTSAVVDGNPNTMWAGPAGTVDCYVMVDLEEAYVITSVLLYNRNDITTEQYRRNVNIEFSNTPDFSVRESVVAMSGQEAPFGEPVEVKPLTKTPYRYVRAIKTNSTTHVVNELEISVISMTPMQSR